MVSGGSEPISSKAKNPKAGARAAAKKSRSSTTASKLSRTEGKGSRREHRVRQQRAPPDANPGKPIVSLQEMNTVTTDVK